MTCRRPRHSWLGRHSLANPVGGRRSPPEHRSFRFSSGSAATESDAVQTLIVVGRRPALKPELFAGVQPIGAVECLQGHVLVTTLWSESG